LGDHSLQPLIEEFKKGLNGNIRRRLAEAESPPTTIEEWWERSVRLDQNLRQSQAEEKVLGGKGVAQCKRAKEATVFTVSRIKEV